MLDNNANAVTSGTLQMHDNWLLPIDGGPGAPAGQASRGGRARLAAVTVAGFAGIFPVEGKFGFGAFYGVEKGDGYLFGDVLAFASSGGACGVGLMVDPALISVHVVLELVKGIFLEPILLPAPRPQIFIIILPPFILINESLIGPKNNHHI